MSSLLVVAIDIDAAAFHAAIFDPCAEKIVYEVKTKPDTHTSDEHLLAAARRRSLRVYYESIYLGFLLKRQLEGRLVPGTKAPGTTNYHIKKPC